jgi:hypothetical protein
MRPKILILAATLSSVQPIAFAGGEDAANLEAIQRMQHTQRVQRICDLASQGAPSFFKEIFEETDTAMKWLSVVEAMPNALRHAFAHELLKSSSSIGWVKSWVRIKGYQGIQAGSRVHRQLLSEYRELAQQVNSFWVNVEMSLEGNNRMEVRLWRKALEELPDEASFGAPGLLVHSADDLFIKLHSKSFIENTMSIASICVLSLPEEEVRGIVSKWRANSLIPLGLAVAGSVGLGASTQWLYGGFALFIYDFLFSEAGREYFSLRSYGRVLKTLNHWAEQMKDSGAQPLSEVGSRSFEILMNTIRTEGLRGLSKIDVARIGLSELWAFEGDIANIRSKEHRSTFEKDALELGIRISQYRLNALAAGSDAARIALGFSSNVEDSAIWAELLKTLVRREKTAAALLDQFAVEFFSPSKRVQFLKDINSKLERKRVLPLVEFFNRPVVLDVTSGLQIEGTLFGAIADRHGNPAYIKFIGPTKLFDNKIAMPGQGFEQHLGGYGTPVGRLRDRSRLEDLSDEQLAARGITPGKWKKLEFLSGVTVEGRVKSITRSAQTGLLLLITWEECEAIFKGDHLFKPEWGTYDMGVGAGLVEIWNVAEFQ